MYEDVYYVINPESDYVSNFEVDAINQSIITIIIYKIRSILLYFRDKIDAREVTALLHIAIAFTG